MANMNDLSLRIKKLWSMLKFFKSRSKVIQSSKFIVHVPLERPCHKE